MPLRLALVALYASFIPSLFGASCSTYPAGKWTRDQSSALEFEQRWLDILNQKNTAALDCMLAPEFADTSRKGVLRPRAQVLEELRAHKEQDQYRQTLSDMKVDLFRDTAVIHGVNQITDQQGREVLRIRFTDVLYFANHHWLAAAAQETDEAH